MALIPFPDVPQVPGVPAVFRNLTIPTPAQLLNIALGGITDLIFGTPLWGVYDQDGNKVLEPDSFLGIRFRNGARVPNAPMEAGSFSSYNKVQTPFDAVISMAISADLAARQVFLGTVGALVQTTDLYAVVTPEISYGSANMVDYSYTRSERQGVTLIIVELFFKEIRESAVAQFSQVQAPSGANPVNDGQVQAFPLGSEPGQPLILTTAIQ